MVILAAAATVIASQAVISGAFSLTQQAAQIGYLPRLRIAHTSEERVGQIYVPWINWALCVAVLALVFTFRTSTALAYAYGVAVTGTITITTLLYFYIVRSQWKKPLWLVLPGAAVLIAFDLLFFTANLTKLPHGAWLPLAIGLAGVHRPHHLAEGPVSSSAGSARTTRDRCASSSTSCTRRSRRCPGCRAPRSSSTGARPPRRSPCAPTWSTTTCCTTTC